MFEFTIEGNIEDAVNISKEVQEFFSGNELSALIGMAVEDMIIYILESNDKVDLIDSVIRNDDDSILVSILLLWTHLRQVHHLSIITLVLQQTRLLNQRYILVMYLMKHY